MTKRRRRNAQYHELNNPFCVDLGHAFEVAHKIVKEDKASAVKAPDPKPLSPEEHEAFRREMSRLLDIGFNLKLD